MEQLPRHVAAPLGHVGTTSHVGGASADTRLADSKADLTGAARPKEEPTAIPFPTDSKEKEKAKKKEKTAKRCRVTCSNHKEN